VTRESVRTRACDVRAGYSAGWCAQATGLPTEARELACRAEGVGRCRLLVGHAERIAAHLADPRFHRPTARYSITPARVDGAGSDLRA
jgi:hypothetical protein